MDGLGDQAREKVNVAENPDERCEKDMAVFDLSVEILKKKRYVMKMMGWRCNVKRYHCVGG